MTRAGEKAAAQHNAGATPGEPIASDTPAEPAAVIRDVAAIPGLCAASFSWIRAEPAAVIRDVAAAWDAGPPLEAFERLAHAFGRDYPAAELVRELRRLVDDLPAPAVQAPAEPAGHAEVRQLLEDRAAALDPPPERHIDGLLRELRDAANADPRLAWLAEPAERALQPLPDDQPLRVAVLGVFSCGKSSLINALLGESVLPVGLQPITAALTVLTYAERPRVRVHYVDGRREEHPLRGADDLARFTAQRGASVASQVERVVVGLPNPRLARLTLYDTPGFNSGFELHDVVTERVILGADAVLWVFNATKAGSEVERREIAHMRRSVGRAIGVVNLIDQIGRYARDPDRWRRELDGVLEDLADRFGGKIARWVPVSAAWMTQGHPESGHDQLLDALAEFDRERAALQTHARRTKRQSLATQTLALRALRAEARREATAARRRRKRERDAAIARCITDWDEELQLDRHRGGDRPEPWPYSREVEELFAALHASESLPDARSCSAALAALDDIAQHWKTPRWPAWQAALRTLAHADATDAPSIAHPFEPPGRSTPSARTLRDAWLRKGRRGIRAGGTKMPASAPSSPGSKAPRKSSLFRTSRDAAANARKLRDALAAHNHPRIQELWEERETLLGSARASDELLAAASAVLLSEFEATMCFYGGES